jgi:hypothetical protein
MVFKLDHSIAGKEEPFDFDLKLSFHWIIARGSCPKSGIQIASLNL